MTGREREGNTSEGLIFWHSQVTMAKSLVVRAALNAGQERCEELEKQRYALSLRDE